MRRGLLSALGLLGVGLWAADQPVDPKLDAALQAYLKTTQRGAYQKVPPADYRVHQTDLNGDGHLDALVLMLGRYYGGTGGRSMYIFRGGDRFQFVSRMTLVNEPVCVMKTRTKGWLDLAILVSGGGAKRRHARMQFNGAVYPLNPSVQPVMQDWPEGDWVMAQGDATVKALGVERTHFTGVLGKSTRFQLSLKHENGPVQGAYFYEKYGKWIQLEGSASGARVQLEEKDKGRVTARLNLVHQSGAWTGQWRSADGKRQYPLRLTVVATDRKYREEGPYESVVETAYPSLNGESGRRFNGVLAQAFLTPYRAALKEFDDTFTELEQEEGNDPDGLGASWKRWTHDDSAQVRYYSPDLVSVVGEHYEYTGGAHGNYGHFMANFWWHLGRARPVQLADCFDAGKEWRSVVGGYIRRDLKKQGAGWPPKTNSEAIETAFFFSPAGVEFHYAPYHVGSYAEGLYTVLVPYTELRGLLKRTGPLARWAQ